MAPAIAAPTCGDIDRYRRDQGAEAPVVQWRPGVDVAADPNARELHALTVSPPEARGAAHRPADLGGGKDDPSDSSSRLAIGTRADGRHLGAGACR